ncbi:DUF305 domain-containing protein, partial [Gammaproteobacteria bacterium]|nr:DUF305 domain-containing protein [Gammaproteobacteria bacterium]
MNTSIKNTFNKFLVSIVLGIISVNVSANAPILQPGAPGEPTMELDPDTAIAIASSSYTSADVEFMQGMIVHHYQAFLMSEMATARTNNQTILGLAGRIDVSQTDEINFMKTWLSDRAQTIPDPAMHNHMHDHKMMGMATPEQMSQLEASNSIDFDRLYLSLMIKHHDGAIDMVERLYEFPG